MIALDWNGSLASSDGALLPYIHTVVCFRRTSVYFYRNQFVLCPTEELFLRSFPVRMM
jgi:hypothetical protein